MRNNYTLKTCILNIFYIRMLLKNNYNSLNTNFFTFFFIIIYAKTISVTISTIAKNLKKILVTKKNNFYIIMYLYSKFLNLIESRISIIVVKDVIVIGLIVVVVVVVVEFVIKSSSLPNLYLDLC